MPKAALYTLDVVALAPLGGELAVLLQRGAGARRALPWGAPRDRERLTAGAHRVARTALGAPPAALEQVGAFGDGLRHPSGADLSVAFAALVTAEQAAAAEGDWVPTGALPALPERQRAIIAAAVEAVRARADRAPVAFQLLPAAFTLSALQETYELLLDRRLHKASFRRALHAARLVQPIDEWRSEGRGRPAQLFRYAPRKRRRGQRGVRFDVPT